MTDIFEDMSGVETFLDLVAHGITPECAAFEVDWSLGQLKKRMKDPDFRELVAYADTRANGNMSNALYRAGVERGNVAAMLAWLYNKDPEHWRDTKRIEVRTEHTASPALVASVKEAALQLVRSQGPEAVQALGPPRTVIEVEAFDD